MLQIMTRIKSVEGWAKSHAALTGLIGLLFGTVLGVGVPIWQNYWVDASKLSVEIYAIERQVPENARIPADDESLTVLSRIPPHSSLEERLSQGALRTDRALSRGGYTPKEAAELLSRAKSELKGLPEKVQERTRQLREVESVSSDKLSLSEVTRLNTLVQSYEASPTFSAPTAEGKAEREKAAEYFRTEYAKRLEELQKRYTELQMQLPTAERRIEELKKDLEDKKSFFQITAILNNAGRKSISARQLALLRVYIGKGNYVDLKLNLKDYQTTAEVAANGTRIAVFSSDLLEAFTDADRVLIGTYWGQSVHGVLFVEDVEGIIHSSNHISFAKGLYIKEVFDRLTAEASRPRHQQVRD